MIGETFEFKFDRILKRNWQISSERKENPVSRISIHTVPDQGDIRHNQEVEPEGERLRRELTEWLRINKISSIMLDTDEHCVTVDIAKLPPNIKPVLTCWGAIYVKDEPLETVIAFSEEENKPTRKFRAV